ncbi:hypothetical protein GOBAR_DD35336 [Gossypium barbadense]|nr:hypothetical protein GOBAR_DD35336 [Gossypium barbadense]
MILLMDNPEPKKYMVMRRQHLNSVSDIAKTLKELTILRWRDVVFMYFTWMQRVIQMLLKGDLLGTKEALAMMVKKGMEDFED